MHCFLYITIAKMFIIVYNSIMFIANGKAVDVQLPLKVPCYNAANCI